MDISNGHTQLTLTDRKQGKMINVKPISNNNTFVDLYVYYYNFYFDKKSKHIILPTDTIETVPLKQLGAYYTMPTYSIHKTTRKDKRTSPSPRLAAGRLPIL